MVPGREKPSNRTQLEERIETAQAQAQVLLHLTVNATDILDTP